MTDVLIKRGNLETGTQEEHHTKMKAENCKPRNTKDCQETPEAGRKAWNRLSLPALRRNQPCWHLDLRHLASRTEMIDFCCLSPSVWGTLLQQPWQTNMSDTHSVHTASPQWGPSHLRFPQIHAWLAPSDHADLSSHDTSSDPSWPLQLKDTIPTPSLQLSIWVIYLIALVTCFASFFYRFILFLCTSAM